jgi:addiction module HigA family antidote
MSKSSTTTRAAAILNRVTTHPGEVLSEEFLRPLGMSANALAMALRVPATRIGAIVKGERSVTADTALRIARFFGISLNSGWVFRRCTIRPRRGKVDARSSTTCGRGPPILTHRLPFSNAGRQSVDSRHLSCP